MQAAGKVCFVSYNHRAADMARMALDANRSVLQMKEFIFHGFSGSWEVTAFKLENKRICFEQHEFCAMCSVLQNVKQQSPKLQWLKKV